MNAKMKVINQSRVALMKTFYNFVVHAKYAAT